MLRLCRLLEDFQSFRSSNGVGRHCESDAAQTRSMSFRPTKVVQRCVLMTTDPGDLVLDPTCGSGTTATSLSNGVVAGSRSTPRASRSRSPALASWVRAIPTTCSRTRPTASSRRRRSRGTAPARSPSTTHPPRVRLRARAAHHAQVDRQQRRDRRHLGAVAGDAGAASRGLNAALQGMAGMGDPA